MHIVPKAGPTIIQPGQSSVKATEMRARAISMIQGQAEAVKNPTSVSPEEMGAIRAPSKTTETGQPYTSEASTETVKEAPKTATEEQLSSHYANLARKEKAQRSRDAQLKAREEALRAREAALTPKPETFDSSKHISRDRLTTNPLEVLNELGLTYEQLTDLAMNAPRPEDVQRRQYEDSVKADIQALRDEQARTKKFYEDQQTQSYQQAVAQIKTEAKRLVDGNEEFETIRATNSVDDVVELIERTFKEENILLSVEDASKAVEDYLVEEAMKLTKIKKIQQRFAPATQAVAKQEPGKQATTLKTLTNQNTSSRPLTAKERAILAFKGEKV